MLEGLLPGSSSRLRIFLSYASEQRRIAEELAYALRNDGHHVFFDKESLVAGEGYHQRIRDEINRADRFVFLISRGALEEGRFTLSELELAKDRWPKASGHVIPVLLDKSIDPATLPAYLRMVQLQSIAGNATADIAAAIDATRRVRPGWLAGLGALLLAVLLGGGTLAWQALFPAKADVAFIPPARVDFRPLTPPPERGGQGDAWLKSPVMLSALQFGYRNQSTTGRAQVEPELVELRIDATVYSFEYRYEIDLVPNCKAANWHCSGETRAMRILEPSDAVAHQRMFRIVPTTALTWEAFADRIVLAQKGVSVAFAPRISVSRGSRQVPATQLRHECMIDLDKLKAAIAETRQTRGRIPLFMQQACRYT